MPGGANRYFYVGYIQEDGVIHHFGPRYIERSEMGERFVYRTGYTVAPPHGTELILAVASPTSPVDGPRPPAELAATWLAYLDQRLAGSQPGVAVRYIIVETRP